MAKRQVYLSLTTLRRLAEAGPHEHAIDLARELGQPYFTVAKALQRFRQRGGWHEPIAWRNCAHCGQPLAWNARSKRVVHPGCVADWAAARQRRYRREKRPGVLSTPYVVAWERRNPERARALYEQDKARRRARWPEMPPAERQAMLGRARAADQRDQPLTAELADQSGAPWSADDDAYVWQHLRSPARDVALVLGRTLWAVRNRRVYLRRRALGTAPA